MSFVAKLAASSVAFIVSLHAHEGNDDSGALLARFRREAPEAWERLEKYDEEFTYNAQVTTTDTFFKDNRTVERRMALKWIRRPGCLLVEKEDLDGKNIGRKTVLAHTERYMFHVNKARDPGSRWQLVNAAGIKEKTDTQFLFMGAKFMYFPTTTFASGTFYRFLDLASDKTITFERASEEDGGIRIDYHNAGKTVNNNNFQTRGWIVLDPGNNWALRSYRFSNPDDLRVTVVNTFGEPDRNGIRRIVSTNYHSIAPHGTVHQDISYTSTRTGPAEPEEFRLASFDLPDPLGPLPRRFPTTLALIVGAFVCGVVALWFRRRSRKAQLIAG